MLCVMIIIIAGTESVFRSAAIIAKAVSPGYGHQVKHVCLCVTPSYTGIPTQPGGTSEWLFSSLVLCI